MIKIKAFAKINLFLKILSKRPDGYHNIQSLFQSISLHDLITLEAIDSGIMLNCDNQNLPQDKSNLAWIAAEKFMKTVKCGNRGIKITISKNIPIAAGLGGGSADAAAVIWGINQLFKTNIDQLKLIEIASQVGADVPFCLIGGRAVVEGLGEQVKPDYAQPDFRKIIVIKPDFEVSTAWAYKEWDQLAEKKVNNELKNDFETVIASRYPEINTIKEELRELGASQSQMSGSGSSIFGLFVDANKCEKAFQKLQLKYPQCFICEPAKQGIQIV